MQSEPWDADRLAQLKKLWAQGETATAIATRLGGLTRSAVLGKIFRLRLAPGKPNAPAAATAGAKVARRRGADESTPKKKTTQRGKSIFELTNTCCRWPFRRPGTEKYFFCGVEEADLARGMPYCSRHMKRAYNVLPGIIGKPVTPSRAA